MHIVFRAVGGTPGDHGAKQNTKHCGAAAQEPRIHNVILEYNDLSLAEWRQPTSFESADSGMSLLTTSPHLARLCVC